MMVDAAAPLQRWALLLGAGILLVYEVWVGWRGQRSPERVARRAHARLRSAWVLTLGRAPGFEIVAVQTLRNSLMSATITASTAALCMMGLVSLSGHRLLGGLVIFRGPDAWTAWLDVALLGVLFVSFVCSAFAMRYYNHAGFVVSMPVGSDERRQHEAMAVRYVEQAGVLYGWGLRCFLLAAPLLAGIVAPLLMPAASAALVVVLWWFDRPAPLGPLVADTP